MAANPTNFVYRNIKLYKSESLGSGSYGGVCKAKCDGLLCAAKIMHPTLFDLRDPGTATYLSKFLEECHLLSLARHPNVVQYLGTFTDPHTRLPVLLMELCEESLTAFLERSPGPLSYHIQVDICHDIALALVYLHSNGLIHRDLTGNNVLMIAGPRAKITDFGMSKLSNVNTGMTLCPGNQLYMSPEALDEVKSYTAKLDIFSFGVIILQILTRKFPAPTDRFLTVYVAEFGEELRRGVPEVERRKEHLALVSDSDPLRLLVIRCLKREADRPLACELCSSLSEMKRSAKRSNASEHIPQRRECHESKTAANKGDQISKLEKVIAERDHQIREQRLKLEETHKLLHKARTAAAGGKNVADISQMSWKEGKEAPEPICRGEVVVHEDTAYIRPAGSSRLYSYTNTLGKERWTSLPENMNENFGLAVLSGLLTSVGGNEKKYSTNVLLSLREEEGKRKWLKVFPPMPTARCSAACITTEKALIVAGGLENDHTVPIVEVMALDIRQWSEVAPLPQEGWLWSSTLCNNNIYLAGGSNGRSTSKSVFSCSLTDLLQSTVSSKKPRKSEKTVWREISELPVTTSTLISLGEIVYAVGGRDLYGNPTSNVYMYNMRKRIWRAVTNMKDKKALCLAFVFPYNNSLTVVGGYTSKSKSRCVDVLIS